MTIELFKTIEIAASGMSAQRRKMNAVAENIANVETTRTAEGGPYKRKQVVFTKAPDSVPFGEKLKLAAGRLRRTRAQHLPAGEHVLSGKKNVAMVESAERVDPNQDVKRIYDPTHPDADPEGFVNLPDINVVVEMVDMMSSSRAFEANLTTIEAAKRMAERSLEI